jgi:hypothetical protein
MHHFVRHWITRGTAALALGATLVLLLVQPVFAALLVGNTRGDSVSSFNAVSGAYLGDFITAGSGGLKDPDTLLYGPDGNLYVSSASSNTSGQILRYDGQTGAFIDVFAQGNGLARPYGMAFGPDGNLYVASFRSDQILRFNGQTGAFTDVFAQGNGTATGLLNGPNGLHFGPDGALFVTTQGSVADGRGGINYRFESQVLRYDTASKVGSLFAAQPTPTPRGGGYVSLLGVEVGPDGLVYTTDFAGGIRSYNATTGVLVQTIDTGRLFGAGATTLGDLEFGDDGWLYVSIFDSPGTGTAGRGIARCDVVSAACSVFASSSALARPIGLVFTATNVPEPGTAALVAAACLASVGLRRRSRVAPTSRLGQPLN